MSLFRAEWARLQMAGLLLSLAHLGGLLFLARMVDLGQQPLAVHWSFAAVYALTGALLGYAQFAIYARPNPWLSLIHRPRSPTAIAAALLGAGLLLLIMMIALPIALTALWQQGLTARVVDLRHGLLALAGWQIAACAYFGGAFAVLAPRRYAWIGLVFLFWLINARASGLAALAVQAIALLWTALLVWSVFRADRDTPPQGLRLLLIAPPLALGLYLGTLVAFTAVELGWIAWGNHPHNGVPPAGGHNEMDRADARGRMLAALVDSAHPDAALLAEQVKLAEPVSLGSALPRLPQWHELTNVMAMEFDDEREGLRWVFSHDDARLHGYRIRDGAAAGLLDRVFTAPPVPMGRLPGMDAGDSALVAGGRLYQYQSQTGQLHLRLDLADQALLSVAPLGEALAVLSDTAVHVIDVRALLASQAPLTPRSSLALAAPFGQLAHLDLIELVDGHLIVATYSHQAHAPRVADPFQLAQWLHSDDRVETIARRELRHDFGWLYRYQAVWLSPALYVLREQARWLFSAGRSLERTAPAPVPLPAWLLAAGLHLLALVLAFRSTGIGPRRWIRVLACALFGLPMLAALQLLRADPGSR